MSDIDRVYSNLGHLIINTGTWVDHKRTGKKRKTIIGSRITYDCSDNQLAAITTRRVSIKTAIAEMICYWRGYSTLDQFHSMGVKTWDKTYDNWTGKKPSGDMGPIYGVQGRSWINANSDRVDQLKNVVDKLKRGIDDNNLVMTFVNPGEVDGMCLPACMHTHRWNLINGVLHQHSFQRSADVPLGLVFNTVQASFLLCVMAKITGHKPGMVYHTIDNAHVYDDQMDLFKDQMMLSPCHNSRPIIDLSKINDLNDLDYNFKREDIVVTGYEHGPDINYPLAG